MFQSSKSCSASYDVDELCSDISPSNNANSHCILAAA